MSEASGDRAVNVLHIQSLPERSARQSAAPGWIASLLSNPRVALIECPDVYRGLARLGHDDDRTIRAVIVGVDALTPVELEFFELTSRLHRDVPVYVYGRERARWRIDEALAHGARAEVNQQTIGEFMERIVGLEDEAGGESFDEDHDDSSLGHAAQPVGEQFGQGYRGDSDDHTAQPPGHAPQPPIVVTDEQDMDDEESDDFRGVGEDKPAGPARVPWLTYDGAPERSAPERTPPGSTNPADRAGTSSVRRNQPDYEPLLTDEELRALIGDDLTSLGPERVNDRAADDPNRAGGPG